MPHWQRNLVRLVIVIVCIYMTAFLTCGPSAKHKKSHLKRGKPFYRAEARLAATGDRFIGHL